MSQEMAQIVSDNFPLIVIVAVFVAYYFGVVRKQIGKYDEAVAGQKDAIVVLNKILAALEDIKAGLKGEQS